LQAIQLVAIACKQAPTNRVNLILKANWNKRDAARGDPSGGLGALGDKNGCHALCSVFQSSPGVLVGSRLSIKELHRSSSTRSEGPCLWRPSREKPTMALRLVFHIVILFGLGASAVAQVSPATPGTSRVTYRWEATNSLLLPPSPSGFGSFLVISDLSRGSTFLQYTETRPDTTYGTNTTVGSHLYYVAAPARRDPSLSTKLTVVTHSFLPAEVIRPSITSQPASQEVMAGSNVTFAVGATSAISGLTFQWQKNGANLAGSTGVTLALRAVTAADQGNYTVVVGNGSAAVTSNPATLKVNPLPTVPTGDFGTFKLEPFGSPNPGGGSIADTAIIVTIPKVLKKDFVFLGNTGPSVTQYFTRLADYTIDGAVMLPRRLVPAGKPTGEALGVVFYEAQAVFGAGAAALITSLTGSGSVTPGEVRVSDFLLYAIKTVREKNYMIFRYRFMLAVGGPAQGHAAAGTRYARTSIMDAFSLDFHVGPLVENSTLNASVDDVDWDKAGYVASTAATGPLSARIVGLHMTPGWDSWLDADGLSSADYRAFNTALQLAPKNIVDVQTRLLGTFGTGNLGHANWTTTLSGEQVAQPAGRTSSEVLDARAQQLEAENAAAGGVPLQLSFWAVLPTGGQYPAGGGTGSSGSAGPLGSNPAGPSITAQPRSQVAVPGGAATFTLGATGATAYQWKKNDVAIAGATTSTLGLRNVTAADSGLYTALVRNAAGEENMTTPVTLNVSLIAAARLPNLSIRTRLGTEPLIIGFTVGGSAVVGAKPLLVRAIGPSLAQFGVSSVADDPMLQIFSGSSTLTQNDNWGGTPALTAAFVGAGAFALEPTSKDAAVATSLVPGSFTIHVGTVTTRPGIVLAEIYDLYPQNESSERTPRLTNLSARSHAGTGDDVLLVGFAVDGVASRTVLIRAVGPSLAQFGVNGVLLNPQLELFRSDGSALRSNDDWAGTTELSSTFAQVGAFPLAGPSRDAALLVTLEPGTYTAKVSGVGATAGTALIEIYEVR
jgi:hypothetical protein